jgi:hypothetical protein
VKITKWNLKDGPENDTQKDFFEDDEQEWINYLIILFTI